MGGLVLSSLPNTIYKQRKLIRLGNFLKGLTHVLQHQEYEEGQENQQTHINSNYTYANHIVHTLHYDENYF